MNAGGGDRQHKTWLELDFCVLQFVIVLMLRVKHSFRPVRAAVVMNALVTCELSIASTRCHVGP